MENCERLQIRSSLYNGVFEKIKSTYDSGQTLDEDLLVLLHQLFHQVAVDALDLIDHHSITQLVSPSGRQLFKVDSSSKNTYLVPISVSYCGCQAYNTNVLMRGSYSYCKHLLAIKISQAMAAHKVENVSDAVLAEYFTCMN